MQSIGDWLDRLAQQHEARPAVIGLHDRVSYRELADQATDVAKGLAQLGVAKGTRIGLLIPNRSEWLAAAFGALKLGALVVPLNTMWRAPELEYGLRHADVAVLICAPHFLNHDYMAILRELCPELEQPSAIMMSARLPMLRHVVSLGDALPGMHTFESVVRAGKTVSDAWLAAAQEHVVGADQATIFFTSGTTAAPKGVVHTHASMLHAATNVATQLGLTPEDRTWGYLPFFFTGGFVAVAMATLTGGGAVLVQDVFDAGLTLRLMAEHGCTTLFAWPHQAHALITHPDFQRTALRLRKGPGANTPWAEQLLQAGHEAVGTWGMTETGPMAACSHHDDPLPVRAGAHGRALPGVELRIADAETGQPLPPGENGELLVRGAVLMQQYYRVSPGECFDAEGFFHTGDQARIDSQGLLHFIGRIKDVIKTAGVNVAAAEVEAVLQAHPGVRLAAVTGVPHPTRGENIAAFVVLRDSTCTTAAVLDFCRARLAAYKMPRHLFFCGEMDLPQLGSGKVDKAALRQLASSMIQAGDADRGEG